MLVLKVELKIKLILSCITLYIIVISRMSRMDVCTFRYDIKKWRKLKRKYKNFNDLLRNFLDGLLNE
jgi:hypothetical protein